MIAGIRQMKMHDLVRLVANSERRPTTSRDQQKYKAGDILVGRVGAAARAPSETPPNALYSFYFVEYLTESRRVSGVMMHSGRYNCLWRGIGHGRHGHEKDAAVGLADDGLRSGRSAVLRHGGVISRAI